MVPYGTWPADPYHLARKLGVAIEERERGGRVGNLIVFSEYQPHPPTIIIYKDAFSETIPTPAERITHEIFHHLVKVKNLRFSSGAEEEAAAEAFRKAWVVL